MAPPKGEGIRLPYVGEDGLHARPVIRKPLFLMTVLAATVLIAGTAWAEEGFGTAEGPISRFVKGSTADEWGRGDAQPVDVEGNDGDIKLPPVVPEKIDPRQESEDDVSTRIITSWLALTSIPQGGDVGDDPDAPQYYPSYRRGWESSQGGALQIGFDAGFVGVFVDLGFQVFKSKGMQVLANGDWYRYSDIRVTTICPGFKIQLVNWMKYLYAGQSDWQVSWYDYMLHSFPYLKFGVGPIFLDALEVTSNADPTPRDYWDQGLSYTFFAILGLEWRPFGKTVSLLIEGGVQAFVFTTDTAWSKSPDYMFAYPVRLGLAVSF